MSIKTKIIINAIGISWFSIIFAGGLMLWRSEITGAEFLTEVEKERLTSIRYFKSQQIVKYFKGLADNLLVLANDQTTINALQGFSKTFSGYLSEVKSLSSGYKGQVINQYLGDFVERYKYYNGGKTVDAQKMLNLISENGFALQYKYIFENPYSLLEKDKLVTVEDGSQYSLMHSKYHNAMAAFKQQFGFYDLFLIDKQANVVYTVNKEIDFTTSLMDGPYATSSLAGVFKQVMASDKPRFIAMADFAPYLAFYDNQAAFMGMAVFDEKGNKLGVVIAQLSVENLNSIMSNEGVSLDKIGLGKSVNSVIVGPDYKLRTDNRFLLEDKEGFLKELKKANIDQNTINLIKAKNSCIGVLTTNTLAVREAFAGKDGFIEYVDYREIPVIGSFAPLPIPGLNWVIIVKINQAEAFKGIKMLKDKIFNDSIIIAIFIAVFAALLGVVTANSIVKSIYKITNELNDIAQSRDLTRRLLVPQNSEFIVMVNAFNNFIASVQLAFKNIQNTVVSKLQQTNQEPADIKKDVFDLVDQINDLSKEFKIIDDKNERIKYW